MSHTPSTVYSPAAISTIIFILLAASVATANIHEGLECRTDTDCDTIHTLLTCTQNRGLTNSVVKQCKCEPFTRLQFSPTFPYFSPEVGKCVVKLNQVCDLKSTSATAAAAAATAKMDCEPNTVCEVFVTTEGNADNGICKVGNAANSPSLLLFSTNNSKLGIFFLIAFSFILSKSTSLFS